MSSSISVPPLSVRTGNIFSADTLEVACRDAIQGFVSAIPTDDKIQSVAVKINLSPFQNSGQGRRGCYFQVEQSYDGTFNHTLPTVEDLTSGMSLSSEESAAVSTLAVGVNEFMKQELMKLSADARRDLLSETFATINSGWDGVVAGVREGINNGAFVGVLGDISIQVNMLNSERPLCFNSKLSIESSKEGGEGVPLTDLSPTQLMKAKAEIDGLASEVHRLNDTVEDILDDLDVMRGPVGRTALGLRV